MISTHVISVVIALLGNISPAQADSFDAGACRANLAAHIQVEGQPVPSAKIVQTFQAVFDLYPVPVQKLMCKIDGFMIEQHFDSSASTCGMGCSHINIRKGLFDRDLNMDEWTSWKDQLNFGAKNDNQFKLESDLPVVRTDGQLSFLYFLLIHELGHTVERTNAELNEWAALSSDEKNKFPGKENLCSYWCHTSPIARARAASMYENLFAHTDFLSMYAARLEEEDFADSFAFYVMIEVMKHTYEVRMPGGTVYDVGAKLHSPVFEKKLRLLAQIYGEVGNGFKTRGRRGDIPATLLQGD